MLIGILFQVMEPIYLMENCLIATRCAHTHRTDSWQFRVPEACRIEDDERRWGIWFAWFVAGGPRLSYRSALSRRWKTAHRWSHQMRTKQVFYARRDNAWLRVKTLFGFYPSRPGIPEFNGRPFGLDSAIGNLPLPLVYRPKPDISVTITSNKTDSL